MRRAVCTIAVGSERSLSQAIGFARSLRLIGDETHRVVVTDFPGYSWSPSFDEVLELHAPSSSGLIEKLAVLRRTGADQIMVVDPACLAFRRLAPAFEWLTGGGLTVALSDITGVTLAAGGGHCSATDVGFMYAERTAACEEFLEHCLGELEQRYVRRADRLGALDDVQWLGRSLQNRDHGTILPPDTEVFQSPRSTVGKVAMDVRTNRCQFIDNQVGPRLLRPYLIAPIRPQDLRTYQRQLRTLETLSRFADRHGFGYMTQGHKLRRSVEKRILKRVGKL